MLTSALLIVAAIGVALLRFGWDAREPAQVRLTMAGWAAILTSVAVLGWRDGAWGVAMATLPVMAVAFAFLAREAATSVRPARTGRAVEVDTSAETPVDWRDIARRFGVFLISVPVAGAVSLLAGLAFAATARAGGASEADVNVLVLSVTPLVWCVLGVVLLLNARLSDMVKPLAALGAVSGAIFWSLG